MCQQGKWLVFVMLLYRYNNVDAWDPKFMVIDQVVRCWNSANS